MAEQIHTGSDSQLCRNCHTFYGRVQTDFLCSKCFQTAHKANSALPPPLQPSIDTDKSLISLTEAEETQTEKGEGGVDRCGKCEKPLRLIAFGCRCGGKYCSKHRLGEEHECGFDHRLAGQECIRESNPVVVGEKVEKI